MKKKILLILGIIYSIFPMHAIQTVLHTSLYGVEQGNRRCIKANLSNNVQYGSVKIINNTGDKGEIVNAIQYAELLFTDAMSKHRIDIAYLNAHLYWGESNEFESSELCKVNVIYDSEAQNHQNYPHITLDDEYILYPLALSLQAKGSTTENMVCVEIDLNPDIPYYYGTDANPGLFEYDLVTILLRALTIGCGFQSTLNTQDLTIGTLIDGNQYLNVFDAHIYNSNNFFLKYLRKKAGTVEQFLYGNQIFIGEIPLHNDWEYDTITDLSFRTCNYVSNNVYTTEDIDSGFVDLMSSDIIMSDAIHELTKYTVSVLEKIGWQFDITVGDVDLSEENLKKSHIKGSKILSLHHNYSFDIEGDGVGATSYKCELFGDDTTFVAASNNSSTLNIRFDTLPLNIKWKRNPLTKNIVGRITCEAFTFGGQGLIKQKKSHSIEIPYKPDLPIVKVNDTINNEMIQFNLQAFANGSERYVVQYKGYHDLLPHIDTIETEMLSQYYGEMPANQVYRLYVSGINSVGEGDTYSQILGVNENFTLRMRVLTSKNVILYYFSYGSDEVSDVNVKKVEILSNMGQLLYTLHAQPRELIDISSNSIIRGVHYLRVTLDDGRQFTESFLKR